MRPSSSTSSTSVLCILLCCYIYFIHICSCKTNMCRVSRVTNLVPNMGHYNLSSVLEIPTCDYIDIDRLDEVKPNKNYLSIMQLNIRGLLNKQGQLLGLITKSQTDSILLCETWLNKETETLVALDTHKLFSIHRKDRIEGV